NPPDAALRRAPEGRWLDLPYGAAHDTCVALPGVILIEFNELVPRLIDRFIGEGVLPNFARLRRESEIHTTEADEDHPYLEPWIQWITVHSGGPSREHRIHDLGDGEKLNAPNVWDVVSERGGN